MSEALGALHEWCAARHRQIQTRLCRVRLHDGRAMSHCSGCRTINHWQPGARKPYGARLFGVFALVQIGFKFPFGERRIGEFGRKGS
jgi:hypothetical protein